MEHPLYKETRVLFLDFNFVLLVQIPVKNLFFFMEILDALQKNHQYYFFCEEVLLVCIILKT